MSVERNHLTGEEGSSITVECSYSEKYRYSVAAYLSSNVAESSFVKHARCLQPERRVVLFLGASVSAVMDSHPSLTPPVTSRRQTEREEVVPERRLELLSADGRRGEL